MSEVVVNGVKHTFDDALLQAESTEETRGTILVEMARWGMLSADAEKTRRTTECSYRNWRARAYGEVRSAAGRGKEASLPEYKVKNVVESSQEYMIMSERLHVAEDSAARARLIYEALMKRADMMIGLLGRPMKQLSVQRTSVEAERCDPGMIYDVGGGRAMTFLGVGTNGARFHDAGGDVWIHPTQEVHMFPSTKTFPGEGA